MMEVSLDFETTSRIDLRRVGAFRYAKDPSTRVLCWAVMQIGAHASGGQAFSEAPAYDPDTLDPAHPVPPPGWVLAAANGSGLIHAYNAAFEWAILNHACTRLFGWPRVPASAMRCTAARARYHGYGGKLEETVRALKGPPKNMAGHAQMMKMARPRKRKAGESWWDLDEPSMMDTLREYCRDDVLAENHIQQVLSPLPQAEQLIFELDLRMNDTGVRCDTGLVEKLKTSTTEAVKNLNDDVAALTGGEVKTTNQVAKLRDWINERLNAAGFAPVESLDKARLGALLEVPDLPGDVRAAADARRLAAKSSTAKLGKMLEAQGPDDNALRGLLQYYGAARTGRWAGRIVQPQNLPRGAMRDPIGGADMIACGMADPFDVAETEGVDVMTAVSSMIRATLIPDEFELGGLFLAPDYGQIEARVIAWLAGQADVLVVFRRGEDIYVYTAKQIGSDNRQLGKVVVLATGFGMGPATFVETAAGYGIELDLQEAHEIVYGWRDANPEIVRFWYALERAGWECVSSQVPEGVCRTVVGTGAVRVWWKRNPVDPSRRDMVITLPSKRWLVYPNIRSRPHPFHGGESLCYDGIDPVTGKFGPVFTYSGKLAENCLAGDTEVLTDHGWKRIVDVTTSDRVWDGVEWVRHDGLVEQGAKPVMDLDGVRMTPDHKVLTAERGWADASSCEGLHRANFRLPDGSRVCGERRPPFALEIPLRVRRGENPRCGGRDEARQTGRGAKLRLLSRKTKNARAVSAPPVSRLALDAGALREPEPSGVSQLRRAGHNGLRALEKLVRGVLAGHGAVLQAGAHVGPGGQQQGLHAVQLPMGYVEGAGGQPTLRASGGPARHSQADRHTGEHVALPMGPEPVYDLRNAGPRSRFVVRGGSGPMIVHNCTQAVARDVMALALYKLDRWGEVGTPRLTIHDEAVLNLLARQSKGAELTRICREVQEIMLFEHPASPRPGWLDGLPLKVDVEAKRRYAK